MRTRSALLFGGVLGLLIAGALGLGLELGRRDAGSPGSGRASEPSEARRTANVRAAERVAPSVVSVIGLERQVVAGVDPRAQEYFRRFFPDVPTFHSEYVPRFGSGVVLDSKGFFLTNHHLVGNAAQIWLTLPDGREFEAEVVGTDAKYDLAVIRVKQQGAHVFETAPIASTDDLMVGEWVVALGNPFGNLLDPRPSVTVGVVSALHRDVRYGEGEAIYKDMIQTDAAINPGNSGGPLVNADGEVVGINTFIFSPAGGSVGIGFAIPISIALGAAEELILYGHVRGVWVGIAVQPLTGPLADQLGVGRAAGLVVWSLERNSPADRAGLRLGDVIRSVNGHQVQNATEAQRSIFGARVGDTITFRVERSGGATVEIPVTLETLPQEQRGQS
jgi:S1-C subfamily serine protease